MVSDHLSYVCVYNLWQPFPLIATDDGYVDYDTHQKMSAPHSHLISPQWNDLKNNRDKIAESTSTTMNGRNMRIEIDGTLKQSKQATEIEHLLK